MSGTNSQLVWPVVRHWHVVALVVLHCAAERCQPAVSNERANTDERRIDFMCSELGFQGRGRARYPARASGSMDHEPPDP